MPTWLTGALVTTRIAWSAAERPRNSHRSPVRVRSTAWSRVSWLSCTEGVLSVKLWKVLGVAGLAGVAATGVIIARDQRQRAQLTPEEVRERLRERLDQSEPPAET